MKSLFIIQVFLCIFLVPQIGYSQSIHDLARTGNVLSMEQHLKKTPSDLNALSEQGITPFILACYRGNNAVAKLLMEKGADEIIIKNKGQSKEKYLLINIIFINKISYTYMINRFDQ